MIQTNVNTWVRADLLQDNPRETLIFLMALYIYYYHSSMIRWMNAEAFVFRFVQISSGKFESNYLLATNKDLEYLTTLL